MNTRGLLGSIAVGVSMLGLAAAPAQATQIQPNTAVDLCGAGYYVVHAEPIVRSEDPLAAGTVQVQYNPITRSFCGLAVKSRWIGIATSMRVTTVGAAGDVNLTNSVGGFSVYSMGPSRDQAQLREGRNCVLFGASISDPQGNDYFHQSANPAIGLSEFCV